jgi:hypothetical protein
MWRELETDGVRIKIEAEADWLRGFYIEPKGPR